MLVIETKTITRDNLTFIICGEHVYFKSPLQTFLLEETEYYYKKRLKRIALMIELGHIRTYDDLFEHTRIYSARYGREIDAVRCIPVRSSWIRQQG